MRDKKKVFILILMELIFLANRYPWGWEII